MASGAIEGGEVHVVVIHQNRVGGREVVPLPGLGVGEFHGKITKAVSAQPRPLSLFYPGEGERLRHERERRELAQTVEEVDGARVGLDAFPKIGHALCSQGTGVVAVDGVHDILESQAEQTVRGEWSVGAGVGAKGRHVRTEESADCAVIIGNRAVEVGDDCLTG